MSSPTSRSVRPVRWTVLAPALLALHASVAVAQQPDSSAGPLVSRRALGTFAGFVAAGAALYPLDRRLERAFRAPGVQRSLAARDAAAGFNLVGDPGVIAAGVVMLGTGWVARRPSLARAGLHATEAIVLGGSATALLKIAAGRQRPLLEPGDHDDFALGRGRSEGRASFPSGHTTAAFAFASAVSADVRASQWRRSHPRAAAATGAALFGGAALVGAARMFDDKHWASDVAVGAGVGTLAGDVVSAYARAHPRSRLERLVGRVAVVPSARGLALGVATR
ncbi:phosphoesterase PA-phosphatase related protein [Gemmatirosa kalamazoonensis]|uniref:Phosphoesterase PA-phosphatase related protein n=1 Tax=Gemmatirosa kalamazoonensis TaxID=861299 RepID=W0RFD5_9BACT|nr:phosphatase PAP2 family protein [Gemmatirosa kalamazoonensis]AHG89506.1 phosphoesterase PA-phosphatase related protein [Gemmatirosa kalamazoonensis]